MARPVCTDTFQIYRDGRVRLPASFNIGYNYVAVACKRKRQEIAFRKAKPGEIFVLKPYYAVGVGVHAVSPVLSMRRIFRALEVRPEEISGTYEPTIDDEGRFVLRWRRRDAEEEKEEGLEKKRNLKKKVSSN